MSKWNALCAHCILYRCRGEHFLLLKWRFVACKLLYQSFMQKVRLYHHGRHKHKTILVSVFRESCKHLTLQSGRSIMKCKLRGFQMQWKYMEYFVRPFLLKAIEKRTDGKRQDERILYKLFITSNLRRISENETKSIFGDRHRACHWIVGTRAT